MKSKDTKEEPPETLLSYLSSDKALWFWMTLILAGATVAAVFAIPSDLYPFIYVRFLLGGAFVLLLPGYAFSKALYPTRVPFELPSQILDVVLRLAFSMGLSIALVAIVGLLLDYSSLGVQLASITLSLFALMLVFAIVGVKREFPEDKKNSIQTA